MMAFLSTPAGRWTVRALGVPVSWAVLALGFGIDWYGTGDPFLIGMFAILLACGAYVLEQVVGLVMDLRGMRQPLKPGRVQWQGPIPPLSKAKQAKVRQLHKVMADAGVFAPQVPDAQLAFAAFAVDKQPVDWIGVLQSLAEAPYYHPELDAAQWEASWSANLLYDHVPAAWLNPPPGKVAAILWEDESIFMALVAEASMPALGQQIGRGAPWMVLDRDVLPHLAAAGVAVR